MNINRFKATYIEGNLVYAKFHMKKSSDTIFMTAVEPLIVKYHGESSMISDDRYKTNALEEQYCF